MDTARDKAIALLFEILDRDAEAPAVIREQVEAVVDALIDAARAPESEHTRAVKGPDH